MRGIIRFVCRPATIAAAFTLVFFFATAPGVWAEEGPEVIAPRPSLFRHMLVSNGILFGPLMFLLALALAGLMVSLAFGLRPRKAVGRDLVPRLSEAAGAGPDKLVEMTRGDRSCLAQAVAAGVARLPHGLEEARHAVAVALERLLAPQQRALRWLGGLGLLSPLLGLLGTLFGLMLICMEVARSGAGAWELMLVTGLSHALSVLLEGLFLACIAVPAYVLFKNRLHRVKLTTGATADELLTRAQG